MDAHDAVVDPTLKTEDFVFHGTGAAYFRIWIVNLLLSIVTLGIYSAWAKVRRMKYLYENTEMMGARFGYHGDPVKILIGRIVVVAVVGGFYGFARFYPTLAPIGSLVWIVLLPAILALALRFRLRNSSYRGLRFAFKGTIGQSYQAMLMPLGVALAGLCAMGALAYFSYTQAGTGLLLGLILIVAYLFFPLLVAPLFHVQWKRFFHQHSYLGNAQFGFTAKLRQYMMAYLHNLLIFFGVLLVFGFVASLLFVSVFVGGFKEKNAADMWPVIVAGMLFFYVLIFAIQPYMQAMFFNLAWNNTQIAGQHFRSTVSKWSMVKLGVTNLVLTILTLGLFRPFAVIRTQRYLLEHLHLDLGAKGIVIVNGLDSRDPSSSAEGALDLLGDLDM